MTKNGETLHRLDFTQINVPTIKPQIVYFNHRLGEFKPYQLLSDKTVTMTESESEQLKQDAYRTFVADFPYNNYWFNTIGEKERSAR